MLEIKMHGKPLAYLDTAASAQKPQVVIDAMSKVMEGNYANIHRGLYKLSQDLTAQYEDVRKKIAKFINAPSEKNIIFTRNATESINLVAHSWGRVNLKPGDEIILTVMEHHANIVPWQLIAGEIGVKFKVVPMDDRGVLDLEQFEKYLTDKVKLIAFTHISNALGTINPVRQLIQTTREYNKDIKILVDGSQAVVHSKVNVQQLDADFYVFTGHKLYGPTGIGVLYGKYEILNGMQPYQGGGDMIERVTFEQTAFKSAPYIFEAGTPAIIEVIGLGAAIDYLQEIGMDNITAHETQLHEYTAKKLREIPGLKLYGVAPDKAGIFTFTMEGAHASDIAMILDQCGVAVRSGHFCCMPLMERLGVDSAVRASIGLYSSEDDINQLIAGLQKVKDLFK